MMLNLNMQDMFNEFDVSWGGMLVIGGTEDDAMGHLTLILIDGGRLRALTPRWGRSVPSWPLWVMVHTAMCLRKHTCA
jgi:hypothetical protein